MTSIATLRSLPQVAADLGVSRQVVHEYTRVGLRGVLLKAEWLGGRLVVRRRDLQVFLRRTGREVVGV